MSTCQLPVTLVGDNLGDRHRNFNTLVNQAYGKNVPLQDIISLSEKSPIDKLFKIDLASKNKNVEYIVQNLKHDDMLYVSRSLKCLWLLEPEYKYIINPQNLEENLYPEMIQPAVNKMKHWIQLNLKDPERCIEFYKYYETRFDIAIKFLWHCSSEFVLSEFSNIVEKLSPRQLKILCENCPQVTKTYFDVLPNNKRALTRYVNDESNYFNSIKSVLKWDGNIFLDLVEKYFNISRRHAFGSSLTKNVMRNYKERVLDKIELYASSILHMETLALNLTSSEANEVILKLARAEYLSDWFKYQKVEPFFKRLSTQERTLLKKQVFVDKTIDDKIKKWPYQLPKPLKLDEEKTYNVFQDIEFGPYIKQSQCGNLRSLLVKRKFCKMGYRRHVASQGIRHSSLDRLFNRYRFINFERAFQDISKSLLMESSIEGRMHMMLVLVSKSGGALEQVEKLLRFLVKRHRNEPSTLRAAIIRSLVKRAFAWRLPDEVWNLVLELGKDLGLDGVKGDPFCREGFHAAVSRHILLDKALSESLQNRFIIEFSTLTEYKISKDERALIIKRLPTLILPLNQTHFLDAIVKFKVGINDYPNAKEVLIEAARKDDKLLLHLQKCKILRRELFREMFRLKQTNASYINALRYDTSPLDNGKAFAALVAKERSSHDRFLQSLNLYFNEPHGLAEQHRVALEEALEENPTTWLVRPICMLSTNQSVLNRLKDYDDKEKSAKELIKILREFQGNIHKTTPSLDIEAVNWRWIGAKAVANKVFICREKDRDRFIKKLLEQRLTARISLRLSFKSSLEVDTFIEVANMRPITALKVAIIVYLSNTFIDTQIWLVIKSLIQDADIYKRRRILKKLCRHKTVPKNIETDYWVLLLNVLLKLKRNEVIQCLCHVENLLPDVDSKFAQNLITDIIETKLTVEEFNSTKFEISILYFRLVAKYLLHCQFENEQTDSFHICNRFFDAFELLYKNLQDKDILLECLYGFIFALRYSKALINKKMVTSMVIFETILQRLHKILPIERFFEKYAEIDLTVMFVKSIKATLKIKSDIFDSTQNLVMATELVGKIFGKYIGAEIANFVEKYFESIVDLYKFVLEEYLHNYFKFDYGRHLFVTFVVKGLLEVGTTHSLLLAEHIFQKEQKNHIPEPHRSEMFKKFKELNNDIVKIYFHAHVDA